MVWKREELLIAWNQVHQPKTKGGLGVLDIATHNKALLLKNVHKFFNKDNIPWLIFFGAQSTAMPSPPFQKLEGSFWWKAHIHLLLCFK